MQRTRGLLIIEVYDVHGVRVAESERIAEEAERRALVDAEGPRMNRLDKEFD